MRTSNLLVGADLAGVLTLGDNQYECGSYSSFLQSYDPSWGRLKPITHPAIGNHEYQISPGTDCDATALGNGYFDYFDGVGNPSGPAGQRGSGYYSYDVGTWHLIALNSNCSKVSCAAGSPQESWLRSDLAANPGRCTLAYWHHPRFNSGMTHGDTPSVGPFFQGLYDYGADVVLNGHEHVYERFAPQTPAGVADPRGIREFIVGTGGKSHSTFAAVKPNSEARDSTTYGVLELTLHPGGYDWGFAPEAGGTFTDSGSGTCHSAADLSISQTDSPDPVLTGQTLTYELTIQNSGPAGTPATVEDLLPPGTSFVSATASQGSCAESTGTVTCALGALAAGGSASVEIQVTPQSPGTITNSASVQGVAADPAGANSASDESTDVDAAPVPDTYARPRAASPTTLRLVPAYEPCAAPDSTHGPPLENPSCDPPIQSSSTLTIGSPDANTRPASSIGSLRLQVVGESPIDHTNGDQADVKAIFNLTDVLNRADLSDYTGELEVVATLRVTDRYNGAALDKPATVTDLPFRFTVPCLPSPGVQGGSCQLETTVDAVMPDVAREGERAIWAVQQVYVFDGGPDGLVSTADNALFATQGLYTP
jgi:uncharacterized repeat protein (TIGR01451 family)